MMDNTIILDIRKTLKELSVNMDYIKEQLGEVNKKASKILETINPQNEILKNDVENLITQINKLKLDNPEVRVKRKNSNDIVFGIREK